MVAHLDQDPTVVICDGDFVEMDADAGTVTVIMRNPNRKIPHRPPEDQVPPLVDVA
jgi:hypothetical protein